MSDDTQRRWWPIAVLLAVLTAGVVAGVTTAKEDGAATEQATADPAAGEATAADVDDVSEVDDVADVDPFAVPDGTVDELIAYMKKLSERRQLGRTQEARHEHLTKMSNAMVEACDKILAADDVPEDIATQVTNQKLAALDMLVRLQADGALENMKAVASELAESENAEVASEARFQLIAVQLRAFDPSDVAAAETLVEEVDKYLSIGPITNRQASVAGVLTEALENVGLTELAAAAYESYGTRLAGSESAEIAERGMMMLGAARRMNLLGNPLELSGTLVDGSELDWSQYRGKVVLIDFWATWCGPCLGELPNVLANYEEYHDRGFEVVGISLDDDRSALETFLEEREIPWATIYSDNPATAGWGNPLVAHYGVTGIPTVWLVNQEGNVVSLMARGPALGEMLAELLGEPAGDDGAAKDVGDES